MKFKRIARKILGILVFILASQTFTLTAQPPPPADHGSIGNETPDNGGGAPIGGGVFILVALGVGYGGKKVYDFQKKKVG